MFLFILFIAKYGTLNLSLWADFVCLFGGDFNITLYKDNEKNPSMPSKSLHNERLFFFVGWIKCWQIIIILTYSSFNWLDSNIENAKLDSAARDAGPSNTVVCWSWGDRLRAHTPWGMQGTLAFRSSKIWYRGLSFPFVCCNFGSSASSLQ